MNKRPTHGWTGKILRVDLSNHRIEIEETLPYTRDYLGGRGFATRIAWNELRPGCGPFDESNQLMIFTGPLTGTLAPFSGRTTLCTVAPQVYPTPWFTRSSLGGHWGPELKYSGFDGIVIQGSADAPVYLWIEDGKASIEDASHLWGLGTYATQTQLSEWHGPDARALVIGQAGENLSRIAVIHTETESASGQGGFGAVMGSKKLKAIAVRGHGGITVARPEEFRVICRAISRMADEQPGGPRKPQLDPEKVSRYGERFHACTQGCATKCHECRYYSRVPGVVHPGKVYAGQMDCVAHLFRGEKGTFYDWKLGFEAGFEIAALTNDYGLNHWDLLIGLMPWLRASHDEGLVSTLDGLPVDLDDPHFWAEVMRKIAFREGIGDMLAEGGRRVPELLGIGRELIPYLYTGWGYAGHWDGHADKGDYIFYPFWLVSALQWAVDTRAPISSGHGYVTNIMSWCPEGSGSSALSWDDINGIGAQIYGTAKAVDPRSDYEAKEIPAVWHGNRSVMKDSLTLDDRMFPQIFSLRTRDHRARAGDVLGTSLEYRLFVSATGVEMSEEEFELACERIIHLDRAVAVRNSGRSRTHDESVIGAFEYPENDVNPFIGKRISMDRGRFLQLMDAYYHRRGWDPRSGHPTNETLHRAGLQDVAKELLGGSLSSFSRR